MDETFFRIRSATAADGFAAREVVFPVLETYALEPEPEGADADLFDLDGAYLKAGGAFWVVEDDRGEVVATCGLKPMANGSVELRKMYLMPHVRGQGLGKKLLRTAIAKARALGFKRMELETASQLREAIALYESFGFVPREGGVETNRCDQAYLLDL
jgi:putative acetyltransferase